MTPFLRDIIEVLIVSLIFALLFFGFDYLLKWKMSKYIHNRWNNSNE